jgi:hypothetical protein
LFGIELRASGITRPSNPLPAGFDAFALQVVLSVRHGRLAACHDALACAHGAFARDMTVAVRSRSATLLQQHIARA